MVIDLLWLVGGLVVLILGGEILVGGATNIAYYLNISPLVVGLTVVAFGTSAPEMIISVSSSLNGQDALALGNVVGSNICNLALVMGVTALLYPIKVDEKSMKIDWVMTMGSALLLYFFVSKDFALNRFEGIIFLFIIIIYTYFLIGMSRKEMAAKQAESDEELPVMNAKHLAKQIGLFFVGCLLLYIGAELMFVKGAKGLAESMFPNNPEADRIIGLTVVALGTSLPELVASAIAAFKKETDMALGNLLGSCIFNIMSILGVTSVIRDIHDKSHAIVSSDMIWMIALTALVLPIMLIRKKIGRIEGVILLLFYVTYIGYLIMYGQ